MKKQILMVAILFASIALTTAFSAEKKILGRESFKLGSDNKEIVAEKYLENNEIMVSITDKSGKSLLDSSPIGNEEKLFLLDGKPTGLAVKDLTGDGIPEVIATAFYGPASALYVYRYDEAKNKFAPVIFIDNPDPDLCRDFMVSDLPMEDGSDMQVKADNSLVAMGKIYPENNIQKVTKGLYTYKFEGNGFKLIDRKQLK